MPPFQGPIRCQSCGRSSTEAGTSMKECSRCRLVSYCSIPCQTAAWKAGHKYECCEPSSIDTSRRAVTRLRSGNGNPESEVCYLKVTRAWIQDICISGPYLSITHAVPNLLKNLLFSHAGLLYLEELQEADMLNRMMHIRAPLNTDKEKIVFIEIIWRDDSQLKVQLPCPTYNVIRAKPSEKQSRGVHDSARMDSMDLVGAFLTEAAAEEAAKVELARLVDEEFPGGLMKEGKDGGTFAGAVIHEGKIAQIVSVGYDSGEIVG